MIYCRWFASNQSLTKILTGYISYCSIMDLGFENSAVQKVNYKCQFIFSPQNGLCLFLQMNSPDKCQNWNTSLTQFSQKRGENLIIKFTVCWMLLLLQTGGQLTVLSVWTPSVLKSAFSLSTRDMIVVIVIYSEFSLSRLVRSPCS